MKDGLVSRQDVRCQMIKYGFHSPDMTVHEFVEDELPSAVIALNKWIEERLNDWTYELKCPKCGYRYYPKGNEDGTISTSEIYNFCPKCGKELEDPARDTRW